MRKLVFTTCLLIFAVFCSRTTIAQEASQAPPPSQAAETPVHFYHLLFVVQEVGPDGKPTNSRSYTATVSTDPREEGTSIRASARIPVATGSFSSGENNTPVNAQYQYQMLDVGVNIDTHNVREVGGRLSIHITADISSLGKSPDEKLHQPVLRQNKWRATVLIPLDKPTVVFTSDSLDNKGSMQMVVTATSLQ
jgi:hypothetical protein